MEREILFRGKRVDNGEWVEGRLLANDVIVPLNQEFEVETNCIYGCDLTAYEVISETVGQYTGLTDKNGRNIFEKDILKRGDHKYVVEWCDDCAMFVLPCITDETLESDFTVFYGYDFEVIGNAYDNPELMKGEK